MTRRRTVVLVVAGGLIAPGGALANGGILAIGGFTSQAGGGTARVGASINVAAAPAATAAEPAGAAPGAPLPPPPPVLAADSPLLADPTPAGPGSFWYQGPDGESCIYAPSSSPACFAVAAAAGSVLDVAGIAASLAADLDLALGPIDASPAPADAGLTGAASWFWLARAPAPAQLAIALDGETVTVTATPGAVAWSFGDGAHLIGGAGVAFTDGPPPPGAVRHVYDTRCLPGDARSDPYVAPGCGPAGYVVSASVAWEVAFSASGPIETSGTLASPTTAATLVYPVSEVRSFLEAAG